MTNGWEGRRGEGQRQGRTGSVQISYWSYYKEGKKININYMHTTHTLHIFT